MKSLSIALVMFAGTVVLIGCGPDVKEKQLEDFISVHLQKETTDIKLFKWCLNSFLLKSFETLAYFHHDNIKNP